MAYHSRRLCQRITYRTQEITTYGVQVLDLGTGETQLWTVDDEATGEIQDFYLSDRYVMLLSMGR